MRYLCLLCVCFIGCINPIKNEDYFESEILIDESAIVGDAEEDYAIDNNYFDGKSLIIKQNEPPKPSYEKSPYNQSIITDTQENLQNNQYQYRRRFRKT